MQKGQNTFSLVTQDLTPTGDPIAVVRVPSHATTHASAGSDPVTPAAIGAATTGALATVSSALSSHTSNASNPHNTTALQTGAYTSGAVDSLLANYLKRDGTLAMTGNLNANSHTIYGVTEISADSANLGQVAITDLVMFGSVTFDGGNTVDFTGATVTGLGLGSASLLNADNTAGNVPLLDGSGLLATSVLPPMALGETFVVASQAAMLALTAQIGDVAVRSDTDRTYRLSTNSPTTLADWKELLTSGSDRVQSVAGRTGTVVLTKTDVGLANVDNTLDANKPVSTAQASADAAISTAFALADSTHAALTNPHSATAAATADRLALRGASGEIAFQVVTTTGIRSGTPTTAITTSDNVIGTSATTKSGLIIQASPSQSVALFQLQRSDGTNAASFSALAGNAPIWTGFDNSFFGATSATGTSASVMVGAGDSTLRLRSTGQFLFSNSSGTANSTADTGIARNAAGVLEVNNGTAGTFAQLHSGTLTVGPTAFTPQAGSLLHIKGATSGTGMMFECTGGSAQVFIAGNAASSGDLLFLQTGSATQYGRIRYNLPTNKMSFRTNNTTDTLTLDASQQVGIGQATPTSKLDITTNALGTTQTTTSGIALTNTTAAANGAQQISPAVRKSALGWGTTAGTSQAVEFREYVIPTQGTVPSGTHVWESNIAGGTWTQRLSLDSQGTMVGSFAAFATVYAANVFSTRFSGSETGLAIGGGNVNGNATTAYAKVTMATGTATNSSGTSGAVKIAPTYNQTSTAASIDFQIQSTNTALGSGTHHLAMFGTSVTAEMFSVTKTGNGLFSGSLAYGGGVASAWGTTASAVLDFGSILATKSADLTITVTGAALGDRCTPTMNATWPADTMVTAFVSAANTVTVRFWNFTAIAYDPASATFYVDVTR